MTTDTRTQNRTAAPTQWVYSFGDGKADGTGRMRDILGGKGAGIAEMTNAGIPVPPGYTITTAACRQFFEAGGRLLDSIVEEEGRARLIANEIAPRVHNSGHWTIDACLVSQFENHIRAIAGWPLGNTTRHSDAVMTNLIGSDVEKWREFAAEPGTSVHLYGKTEARAGRKMGHVTRLYPKS